MRAAVRPLVLVPVLALVTGCPAAHDPAVTGRTDPAPPGRCTLYAAPTGTDAAPGSRERPLRTVQRLVARLGRGDTGCLRAGKYAGPVRLAVAGTTLRSAPGERATLTDATVEVPDGADDVTVEDLDVVGRPDALTVRLVGDRFTLEGDDITNGYRGRSCILVGGARTETSGGVLRSNVVHHCGHVGSSLDHGLYAQDFGPESGSRVGLLVDGNRFFEVSGYAIQLYPRGVGALVRRNVIDGGGRSLRGGIVVDGPLAVGDVIEQNVIVGTRTGAVLQRTGSGHVARDNCFVDNPSDVTGTAIRSTGNTSTRAGGRCPLSLDVSG